MEPSCLLFGATSILGFTLANHFPKSVVPFASPGNSAPSVKTWPTLNLENPAWISSVLRQFTPDRVIYGHAVCDVPKCEADPDWAYEINVGHLQRVLKFLPERTRFVYVSSDHVFGGDGTYDEDSVPCPISVYGKTRVEAERLVLRRPNALVIRTGLAIGASPNGRTGHLDWLRYRQRHHLPITIVEDEYRSTVWAKDLAVRVMQLAGVQESGLRHVPTTHAISRVRLAHFLLEGLGLEPYFHRESRQHRPYPHLGHVELISRHEDRLGQPLDSVVEKPGKGRMPKGHSRLSIL